MDLSFQAARVQDAHLPSFFFLRWSRALRGSGRDGSQYIADLS